MGKSCLVCPEGCPGSGWRFPWGMGGLGERPMVVFRLATPPRGTQMETLVSGIYFSSIIETLYPLAEARAGQGSTEAWLPPLQGNQILLFAAAQ